MTSTCKHQYGILESTKLYKKQRSRATSLHISPVWRVMRPLICFLSNALDMRNISSFLRTKAEIWSNILLVFPITETRFPLILMSTISLSSERFLSSVEFLYFQCTASSACKSKRLFPLFVSRKRQLLL